MGIEACHTCGTPLVDGPDVERHTEAKGFRCCLKGIPTKVCPKGCAGHYWSWLDFGTEVLDSFQSQSFKRLTPRTAFFTRRSVCRICNSELANKEEATFSWSHTLKKGTEIEIQVTGPCLSCPSCGASFMPRQLSSHDRYYIGLTEVLGRAITEDLIYK